MLNNKKKDNNCLFCEIINKKRKSAIIFENDFAIAFLDIFPIEKGHCLVVPKRCVKNITEISKEEIVFMHQLIKKICKQFEEKLKCKGFNLLNNFNEVAGQVVNHLHFHIIPKYKKGYGFTWNKKKSFYNVDVASVKKEIEK